MKINRVAFVQIAVGNGVLYALDNLGMLWSRGPNDKWKMEETPTITEAKESLARHQSTIERELYPVS